MKIVLASALHVQVTEKENLNFDWSEKTENIVLLRSSAMLDTDESPWQIVIGGLMNLFHFKSIPNRLLSYNPICPCIVIESG